MKNIEHPAIRCLAENSLVCRLKKRSASRAHYGRSPGRATLLQATRHPLIAAGLALAVLFSAHAATGNGNPVVGKEKARAGNCFECHGENGISSSSGYPNLAGQYSAYIVKQLRNFRAGERKNPFMNNIAAGLPDSDLDDIAAYFAGLEKVKSDVAQVNAAARNLFVNGDKVRNILPCISCHGEGGKGAMSKDASYPMIGGQQMFYLREQLLNWNLGTRTNSPGRVMNKIADALSETEIEELARYISGM